MPPDILPLLPSEPHATLRPRRWRLFLRSNGTPKIGFFSTAFFLTGLIVYVASFPPYDPSWRISDWRLPSRFDPDSLEPVDPTGPLLADPKSPTLLPEPTPSFLSPLPASDVLTLEQIRDIVGTTSVRYIFEAALLQAELLNRTLVLPSFLYARACDALGSGGWDGLPVEQQMGFCIPISVISYHTYPNAFEMNKTKTPSLFVIENHWYDPINTTRVDHIPEAMKRGKLERHPRPYDYGGSAEYCPPLETTELSVFLRWRGSVMDWSTAMSVLEEKSYLVGDVDLNDDQVVEKLLHTHGWEVLHTFDHAQVPSFLFVRGYKVGLLVPLQVLEWTWLRPSCSALVNTSFKDDYHDVDTDVVVLAGETHLYTKPKLFDLAEVLSSRMRQLTGGRMWMGAHMRRGNFVEFGWAMEMEPEDHIRHVKERLQAGRTVPVDLHYGRNWTTSIRSRPRRPPPPRADDLFFVATDERDPDAWRTIAGAGAVFISDLLTMEDRRAFGWPLMILDVMAIVEQQLLIHSGFFYGHCLSSFAGAILNMRAARTHGPRFWIDRRAVLIRRVLGTEPTDLRADLRDITLKLP
ncbi:hypothetical protein H4582DRAFT_2056936 [Lactarius indigo]|nr:hypothetical protein H4582DRAFT_2056936 [Lactarius indigo]